jgi:hypothetical protein
MLTVNSYMFLQQSAVIMEFKNIKIMLLIYAA